MTCVHIFNILCHIEVYISLKYGAGITKRTIACTFGIKQPRYENCIKPRETQGISRLGHVL